jgi:uncharacterized membrane protein
MSEEIIYDEAYHEGLKDAVNIFLMAHMEGLTLPQIRERLVNARTNAKVQLENTIEEYIEED